MDNSILLIVFQLVVLLFSVMLHEISHGLMALRLGDQTAKDAGRLTLNPVSHLDPFGSVMLPILLVMTHSPVVLGWAKPVPYNPNALYKDFRYGPLKVALAGPLSNLALALVFGLIVRLGTGILPPVALGFSALIVFINCFLAVFNLVPIPPLDGSKILSSILPPRYAHMIENIGLGGVLVVILFLYFFSSFIYVPSAFFFSLFSGPNGFQALGTLGII